MSSPKTQIFEEILGSFGVMKKAYKNQTGKLWEAPARKDYFLIDGSSDTHAATGSLSDKDVRYSVTRA